MVFGKEKKIYCFIKIVNSLILILYFYNLKKFLGKLKLCKNFSFLLIIIFLIIVVFKVENFFYLFSDNFIKIILSKDYLLFKIFRDVKVFNFFNYLLFKIFGFFSFL